jgi:D-amino peptidase
MVGRVFISVDMEGVAGVTTPRHVERETDDFYAARELMTDEASAAVAGALDAGATDVTVSDAHGDMANLLPSRLDPRARLIQGTPKVPYGMMTGIARGDSCAVFVGYHAGAGVSDGILSHTYSSACFREVRVGGDAWGETTWNAALAGSFGVPVVLVTGDAACCREGSSLPGVATVIVKEGLGARVGDSLSPKASCDAIQVGAARAVGACSDAVPYVVPEPLDVEVDCATTAVADMCALAPGSERRGPITVGFLADDIGLATRCLLTWLYLGSWYAPSVRI